MAGRRTNLALLGLVPLAVVTGALMFLLGGGPVWPVALLHGAVGLAILLLAPWKSVVVRRGLRRARRGRLTSLALSVVVLIALLTGVGHVTSALFTFGGVDELALHVATGVLAAVLVLAHVRLRRTRPRLVDISRRAVLRAGALLGAAGGLAALTQWSGALVATPGARRPPGSYEVGSGRPLAMPVTSWLLDQVPTEPRELQGITVVAQGTSRFWSLGELAQWDDRASVVLDCTGGWWSQQEWSGMLLRRLLPPSTTGSVEVISATGYWRRLPLADDLLLATRAGGDTLSAGHGAPVRLVVPGRRGYHWVKWVTHVEHDQRPWQLQPPLPLR